MLVRVNGSAAASGDSTMSRPALKECAHFRLRAARNTSGVRVPMATSTSGAAASATAGSSVWITSWPP